MTLAAIGDLLWKVIPEGKEKYHAYLCSREWSVLKEAVHQRAGGLCERCHKNPIENVHHLTYARKYYEDLGDLAGWCRECHEFTHGKSNYDPAVVVLPKRLPFCESIRTPHGIYRPEWDGAISDLICPICGDANVHIMPPNVVVCSDRPEADSIVIHADCESGHTWVITFAFSKGSSWVYTENHTATQWLEDDCD